MNMKNIFKLSAMMLAAAFVAGCSQNDELDVTPVENEGQLTIHATASDFVSSDATDTRIANDGANTAFEAGDEIGVFAIRSTDNKLMYQNMPLEYLNAESGWTGNENKIYYYKNTAYVAYSPYDDKLNITDATGIEDLQAKIETYFTEKLDAAGNDQSIAYPSLDLMMASAEPADIEGSNDKSLSSNFKHRFALIEIAVPVKAYLDVVKNFTYAEPFSKTFTLNGSEPVNEIKLYPLSLQTSGEAGDTDAKAYNLFRFLVKPNIEYTLSGELEYATPITLNDKTVNLPVGKYMKYTINATNAVSSYTKRDIAVGDYYYADGSIYPGPTSITVYNNGDNTDIEVVTEPENYKVPTGCIGVIFNTSDVNVTDINNRNWSHGYVLSLSGLNKGEVWSTAGVTLVTDNNYSQFSTNSATDIYWSNCKEAYQTFFTTYNGYALTYADTENKVKALSDTKNFGSTEGTEIYTVSKENSTGWFLPSPGELVLLMNTISDEIDVTKKPFKKDNVNDESFNASVLTDGNNAANKITTMKKLAGMFKIAGGKLPLILNEDLLSSYDGEFWLTSTEYSATEVWTMEWKDRYNNGTANLSVKLLNRKKEGNDNKTKAKFVVRPILAF